MYYRKLRIFKQSFISEIFDIQSYRYERRLLQVYMNGGLFGVIFIWGYMNYKGRICEVYAGGMR